MLDMQASEINLIWLSSETQRELDFWIEQSQTGTADATAARRFSRYVRWSGISAACSPDVLDRLKTLEAQLRNDNAPADAFNEIVRRLRHLEDKLCERHANV